MINTIFILAILFLLAIAISFFVFLYRQTDTSICALVKANGGYQPISTGNKIGVPPKWE